jgi:acyl-CoA thioester hydrolase
MQQSRPFTGSGYDGRIMQFRVYYEDTDAGGVVYHANYLGYFERARTEFLRERGLSVRELHEQGTIFPVVHLEIDFKAPASLDDLLAVPVTVLEVGKTSFTLGQQVVRVADGKVLASGKVTLVCVNLGMKPKRLPTELVEVLKNDQNCS